MRRAVDQMENEGERTEQTVELREVLTDDGVILVRDLLPVEFGRPSDEDFCASSLNRKVWNLSCSPFGIAP